MNENRPLGEAVELVCEGTFLPEGNWWIRQGDMIWAKVEGWKKYCSVKRPDSHFQTAEDAMKAWEQRTKVKSTC
jgi:hypothetical protein